MKKKLLIFLSILSITLILDRAIHATLKSMENRIMSGQGVGKVNYFLKIKDSIDVVIFGNSRASHHVDLSPKNINFFNIGIDGTGIAYSTALINTLEKKNQIILVHIDHDNLFDGTYEMKDLHNLRFKLEDSKLISQMYREYFNTDYLISKVFKCYSYNGKVFPIIANTLFKKDKKPSRSGYEPIVVNQNQQNVLSQILKERKDKKPRKDVLKVNKKVENLIDQIVKVAETNDSNLYFFTSPSLISVNENKQKATTAFFRLKKVKYLDLVDFLDKKSISPSLEFWKDETHLSDKGAAVFSEELMRILRL